MRLKGAWALVILILLLLVLGGSALVIELFQGAGEEIVSSLTGGMRLEGFDFAEVAATGLLWELHSRLATETEGGRRIHLTGIDAAFLKEGRAVTIRSREGVFWPQERNLAMSGGVMILVEDFEVATENVFYDGQERVITADGPVRVTRGGSRLHGDSARVEMEGRRVVMTNVSGVLVF